MITDNSLNYKDIAIDGSPREGCMWTHNWSHGGCACLSGASSGLDEARLWILESEWLLDLSENTLWKKCHAQEEDSLRMVIHIKIFA